MTTEAESDQIRETLAPYLYEAYRLGKYAPSDYLPMWHEKPAHEHVVPWPEVDGAVRAVGQFIGDLQVQLDAAKSANTAVWVAAERASRKGYELDPDEVLDMLKEDR